MITANSKQNFLTNREKFRSFCNLPLFGHRLVFSNTVSSSVVPQVSDSKASTFYGTCHYCHKYGHKISDCRKRLARETKSQQSCQSAPANSALPTNHNTDSVQQPHNTSLVNPRQPPSRGRNPVYALYNDSLANYSCLASQPSSSVPVCTLTVEGTAPATCVIDSGAASSIVSSAFVDDLGLEVTQSSGVQENLIAANGGQLDVVGKIDLTLSVGGMQFHHCFVVIRDFACLILLRSDLLRYVHAVIQYGDGTVTFQSPRSSTTATLPIFSVFTNQDWQARIQA